MKNETLIDLEGDASDAHPIYVADCRPEEGVHVLRFYDDKDGHLCTAALNDTDGTLRVVWASAWALPEPQVLVGRPELRDFKSERALIEALWAHRDQKADRE